MPLCVPRGCGCSFTSSGSVTVTGSGEPGSPYELHTHAPVSSASSDPPDDPTLGDFWYQTNTGRVLVYDGTNWVIVGGSMPGVSLIRSTNFGVLSDTTTSLTFPTEVYDTDAYHVGGTADIVIPAGLGGDYHLSAGAKYAANDTGYRYLATLLSTVPGTVSPAEAAAPADGWSGGIATNNNGMNITKTLRLGAGTTVRVQTYQTSGGSLNVTTGWLSLDMIRHIPTL